MLFSVVGRCRNHLGVLSLNSSWSETPAGLPLETNMFVVLLERVGAFLPQAQRVRRSKIRGLRKSSVA